MLKAAPVSSFQLRFDYSQISRKVNPNTTVVINEYSIKFELSY